MKHETRRRLVAIGLVALAAAGLELLALIAGPASASIGDDSLRLARQALGALLPLGALLCWALPRLKSSVGAPFRSALSQGRSGRLILILTWVAAVSVVEEFAGDFPYALILGLAVLALYAWRKPRLLGFGAVGASLVSAIARLIAVGVASLAGVARIAELERLALIVAAALLCIAIGATIRNAVLRSSDRLNSLERENEQLWELSFRDALTGLFNRRYSQEVGAMLFARAKRYNEQLHVLMLDIDRFKAVNDKLGHPVGDVVLREIAGVLQSQVRASDVATRYGGEEFLIFLIQTEPEVVQFIANRIRDSVAGHAFPGVPWQLTISIGVAGIKADDTMSELVDRADKYLYASKRGGRNRVTGF